MLKPNRLEQAVGQNPFFQRLLALGAGSGLLAVLTVMVVRLSPVYVFGAVAGASGSLLFYARPELGLLGYFGFRMLADLLWWVPISFGGLSILEVLSGGFTALAAVLFYIELRRVERHPVFGALLIYLVVLALSAVRSLDIRIALEILAKHMSPFLILFLVTALFKRPEDWKRVVTLLSLVGLAPLMSSAWHLLTGQMSSVSLAGLNRLQGGYENLHNQAHMMLILTTLYTFWYFYLPPGWWKRGALVAAGAAALFLFLSYVRTPLLGLALFAVLFPALERKWAYVVAVGVAGAVGVAVSDTLAQRLTDILLVFAPDDHTVDFLRLGSGRVGIWTVSMSNFLSRPVLDLVLGVGLGGDLAMVQSYVDQYRSSRGGTLNPHNDYLTLLYQLGPVSVLCYVYMQGQIIVHALRNQRLTQDPFIRTFSSFAAALAALVFVTNTVSNSFVERVTPAMVLWTVAGLVFSQHRWLQHQAEAAPVAPEPPAPRPKPLPSRSFPQLPPLRLRS